jgi:hypothetical protein
MHSTVECQEYKKKPRICFFQVESIVIPSASVMDDVQSNQAAADSLQNSERAGRSNPAFDNDTEHQSEDL